MHHYSINAKTICAQHPNRYNHGKSWSFHFNAHTPANTHIRTPKHKQVLSFLFNKLRAHKKQITWMYLWLNSIWIESNRIEFNWITLIIILCTNALTHSLTRSPNFNQLSIQLKFVQLLNECVACRTPEEKKMVITSFHYLSMAGWLTGWLHLYNLSAFVAAASHAHTVVRGSKKYRTCVYFRRNFVWIFFFIMKIAFWIARVFRARTHIDTDNTIFVELRLGIRMLANTSTTPFIYVYYIRNKNTHTEHGDRPICVYDASDWAVSKPVRKVRGKPKTKRKTTI